MTEETRVAPTPPRTKRRNGNAGRATTRPARVTTPEQRQRMIAEKAYYRAESRGFQGGDPTRDWLEAETEVDALLMPEGVENRPGPKTKR